MGGLGIQRTAGARPAGRLKTEEFEMRKLLGIFMAGALLFAVAGSAQAKLINWHGTLDLQLGTLAPVRATTIPTGADVVLNGSGGGAHLNTMAITIPGLITGGATVPLSDPELSPLVSLRGEMTLGTGIIGQISGGAASGSALSPNVLPVGGEFKLCILFMGCPSFIPVPLTVNGTRGVGIGGLITINGFGKSGIKISALNAPWTIKTAVIASIPTANGNAVTTSSVFGFAHGPASLTSSTAQQSGVVQLVTPVRVTTTIAGTTPLFGILRIHFVPEPGTFLLFGSGVVAMGIAGRRRAKKN
jgi:hypothetical protein